MSTQTKKDEYVPTPFQIRFENPKERMQEERKCKFLDPESDLYMYIMDCQYRLKHSGMRISNKMFPCVQILSQSESPKELELFLNRVKELEGLYVDIKNPENYRTNGKQFELILPSTPSLKSSSIVIGILNHLAPRKERFLNVILNDEYSTESNWDNSSATE
jgi:hypothetical protein